MLSLERPVYGMSQAARLLGLRTDALRRWIDGYQRSGTTYAPVIREEPTSDDTVTWGEFVEAGYLREYRAEQVTLQYLRPVIAILREELGVRYPLATLKPYTSGRNLALKVQKQVGLESGGPGEFRPRAPTERCVNLSIHTALII